MQIIDSNVTDLNRMFVFLGGFTAGKFHCASSDTENVTET